jgi:hypothetical protein
MRTFVKLATVVLLVATTGFSPSAPTAAAVQDVTMLQSIGPLTFGPNDVLFAADTQGASIFALELGAAAKGGAPGAKDIAQIDQKIAALLGTDAAAIAVTDLVVHPTTKNAFIAVMRGQGADAKPALVRVDGNGKLIVAGLSNEEFASKLRTIAYPFASVEPGTSVEIYHGNHGQLETRSPVYAFVPCNVAGTPHLIAGYLCTPLVKFPVASLSGTAGIGYETIASMTGIEQMDLLDAQRSIVLARASGALNLQAVPLP